MNIDTERDRLMGRGCGNSVRFGHGEYLRCGDSYHDSLFLCQSCQIKDLKAEIERLRASVIEECAKHLEGLVAYNGYEPIEYCAASIRALKEREAGA